MTLVPETRPQYRSIPESPVGRFASERTEAWYRSGIKLVQKLSEVEQSLDRALDVIQVPLVNARIQKLQTQDPGLPDDERLSLRTVSAANQFAKELAKVSYPQPRVERGSYGSLIFMWRTPRFVIDVEIDAEGCKEAYLYDLEGQEPYFAGEFESVQANIERVLSIRFGHPHH